MNGSRPESERGELAPGRWGRFDMGAVYAAGRLGSPGEESATPPPGWVARLASAAGVDVVECGPGQSP